MRAQFRFGRFIAMAALLLLGLVAAPDRATAATPMTCVAYGGAPALSGSNGIITAYYSHRCNFVPANVNMTEGLDMTFSGPGANCYGYAFPGRGHAQPAVDFSGWYAIGSCHGYYHPRMTLTITGQFSYGKVDGCYRVDPEAVFCEWFGTSKYF